MRRVQKHEVSDGSIRVHSQYSGAVLLQIHVQISSSSKQY
jgi:hypothetical protein